MEFWVRLSEETILTDCKKFISSILLTLFLKCCLFLPPSSKQKLKFDDHLNVDIVPGENAEGFLDGSKENYESSELNRPDCGFSRFVRATKPDPESSLAVEKSSAGVQQQSFVDKE